MQDELEHAFTVSKDDKKRMEHWRFLDDTSCMIDSKKRGLLQILPQVLVLYVCSLSLFVRTPYLVLALCVLSLFGFPLLFYVLSLFCLPLFLCALSFCALAISSHLLRSALRPFRDFLGTAHSRLRPFTWAGCHQCFFSFFFVLCSLWARLSIIQILAFPLALANALIY